MIEKGAIPFYSMRALLERVVAFQASQFAGQTLDSKLKHLCKEAKELADCNGNDRHEWADLLILFIGCADLKGLTLLDIVAAAHEKMSINERREWLPADADGCFHHKK